MLSKPWGRIWEVYNPFISLLHNMEDETLSLESNEFDYVILGTGLTESLVAAALARIGKSVLILDENPYYGGSSTSLTLDSLNGLLSKALSSNANLASAALNWEPTTTIKGPSYKGPQTITNVKIEDREEGVPNMVEDAQACRRCSIDLIPRLIWSRSSVIDVLIRAGASRYLEFKTIQHLYILHETLVKVPVSKSDVFKTSEITHIEKRQLMKFITTISQPNEEEQAILANFATRPFSEYAKEKKLTAQLTWFLTFAIALDRYPANTPSALSTSDAVAAILHFMGAVGRYGGKTPWLYPLFGMSDLAQSFSRLAAVYGAVFILGKHATEVGTERDENGDIRITSVDVGPTKNLKTKHVIANLDHLPELAQPINLETQRSLARCVLILDSPLKTKENTREIMFSVIPPEQMGNTTSVYVFQLDESASVIPSNKYLIQIWAEGTARGAESDLKPIVDRLLLRSESEQPATIFYCAYWNHVERKTRTDIPIPSNLTIVDSLDFQVGTDVFFSQAENIFKQLCPEEEFIPQVPNPEDIIWGGDDDEEEGTGDAINASAGE